MSTMSPPSESLHPATLDLPHQPKIARWRPLVHWLLAIPHILVLYGIGVIAMILWFISFFTVLFTRSVPEGIHNFQVMTMRYAARVSSYLSFQREQYPPFDFTMAAEDPGGDPVSVSVPRAQQLNRWLPLVKWLLTIPHLIVFLFLLIAVYVVLIIGFFAVIILGRWPVGLHDFLVGVDRWSHRLNSYSYFLRDEYPPFSLK